LLITPYRLSRTSGAAPAEKQLRFQQKTQRMGLYGAYSRIHHALRGGRRLNGTKTKKAGAKAGL